MGYTASCSDSKILLYIDGFLRDTYNGIITPTVNSSPLTIGARKNNSSITGLGYEGFLRSELDELFIYDRVLTPSEVLSSFNYYTDRN